MMTSELEHAAPRLTDTETVRRYLPDAKVSASLLTIIQAAIDGVIIVDALQRIVLANHKAEQLFGYAASQLPEQSINTLLFSRISSEQRRRLERLVTNQANGRRMRLRLRAVCANGKERAVHACLSRVEVREEVFFVIVLREAPGQPQSAEKRNAFQEPARLRRYAVSSQQTTEVEKRRFSKELYDDIGQRLSVLKLDLDWLQNNLPESAAGTPERVVQMQDLLDNVIAMTKTMAAALRPPLLDDFGLLPAVKWMTESFQKRTGTHCCLLDNGLPDRLPEPVKSTIFRVIQESLLNIERHAHARKVSVTLVRIGQQLLLTIADDGVGMDSDNRYKPGCHGLIAMQERIFILGGTITIRNTEPHGVAICVSVPIDATPPP